MAFHEIRFPAALSFGSTGGPERKTDIVALANGFEERNTPWAHSRRRYDAGTGLRLVSLKNGEPMLFAKGTKGIALEGLGGFQILPAVARGGAC